MKKRIFLIVILVVLIGGFTSFYFLWWLPKVQQEKEEMAKELALTSPHKERGSYEKWSIEAITKWKIAPKDTSSSGRTCIWTNRFINRSLDYVHRLSRCEFILKDSNDITIATDYFDFGYSGHLLQPGKSWEANGTLSLSHMEALMVEHSTMILRSEKQGQLASKKIRDERKKEFLSQLKDIENEITQEELYEDPSRCYNIALRIYSSEITADNTQWEDRVNTIKGDFYTRRAKQGDEIFSDYLYMLIDGKRIESGWSDKKIWNKLKISSEYKSEDEEAKTSGMGDKEIKKILGLNVD